MTAALSMTQVCRVHGAGATSVEALRSVDLEVELGEFVAIMGPSGSGKSTLLTIAGGLDSPTSGDVSVDGRTLTGLSPDERADVRRRSIGYVFQDLNLISALTAAENVAAPLELDGMRPRRARRRALEALASVGIAEMADRFPDQMSGGQAQRVAIARALVGDRRLVLADEPTGALDSSTGQEVIALLRDRAEQGAAVLLVTHEARFAAWADRTVFLRDGAVVDALEPADGVASLLPHGSR